MASKSKIIGIGSSIVGTIIIPLIVKNVPKLIAKFSAGKKGHEIGSEPQTSGRDEVGEANETK